MLLYVDKHSSMPLYRQIMEQVKDHILSGEIGIGEQLPSVRELAQKLRVNPLTISKCYGYLEAEKVLERRRGVGVFVSASTTTITSRKRAERLNKLVEDTVLTAIQLGFKKKEVLAKVTEAFDANTETGDK